MKKRDIESKPDIQFFLEQFYKVAMNDQLLAEKFRHLNMAVHIPVITDFWSSLIFYDQSYNGNPFLKHKEMKLSAEHFTRWLLLFEQTLNELYEGERAADMKTRARSIAGIFQHKLGITPQVG